MKDQSNFEKLARQPDLKPPAYEPAPPPSLLIYAILFAFAILLLMLAFSGSSLNQADLELNLATEILGAIIILLLVERRFRTIHPTRLIPITRIAQLSRYSAEVKGYLAVLLAQTQQTSLPFYLSRPEVEAALFNYPSRGLIVTGPPRIGKTTLLIQFVQEQARKALKAVRKESIPVLVSAIHWTQGEAVDILRETMQEFYPVSSLTFRRLLNKGRLIGIFDGLDEALEPQRFIAKLEEFCRKYPQNAIILSCKPESLEQLKGLDLPVLRIPALGKAEIEKLARLRARLSRR